MSEVISYASLQANLQRDINELPIKWAFNEKQYREAMNELGLDPEKDKDKLVVLPAGGFCLPETAEKLLALYEKFGKDVDEQVKIDRLNMTGFTKNMFIYELDNHEYGYTLDNYEALEALGYDYDEDIAPDDFMMEMLYRAEREIRDREE